MRKFKYYGRVKYNKLDCMIAAAFAIFALAVIWFCIGLCIRKAGAATIPAFISLGHDIAFLWGSSSRPIIFAIVNGVLFYASLVYSIVAIALFCVKKDKERIPGVVATFAAALGVILSLAFISEFTAGASKNAIPLLWPYGLVFFLACLIALLSISVFATWSKSYNYALNKKKEPVVEEKVEKEPARVEAIKEEVKEESEEEESSDEFKDLGARRRRIPFEDKIKQCSKETRDFYKEIVDQINLYKVSERTSIPGQTFNYKRNRLIFIMLAGFTLKVHFALDPKKFEGTTVPVKDASDCVKYEQTPAYIKIKSGLASRRAIALVHEVMSNYKVPRK